MKKHIYIVFIAVIVLFSCSKEQPMTPISASQQVEPEMIKITKTSDEDSGTTKGNSDGNSGNDDITDPEKEEKEKTNKKAKN